MERKLIDYLPLFVQKYSEIEEIMKAEQVNIEKSWTSADDVMKDQFILDATENGVKRWESLLKISPKVTYTLDERKFNILACLNKQLPYTLESLRYALTVLCGEDGYTLKLSPDKYELVVKLALSNENNIDAVKDLLDNMIPANLIRVVQLFNTHGIITSFTHGQLAAYTHQDVKEEILS